MKVGLGQGVRMVLTFAELEARIEALLPAQQGSPLFVPSERLAGGVMLVGLAIALIGARLVPPPYGNVVALGGLSIELVAGAVMIWLSVRREPLGFKASRAEFAAELDHDFIAHRSILEWLSAYPASVLEARRQYVRQRQATLDHRRGFVVGSLDRIGMLPLLAAIYLQAKDLRFGEPITIGWVPSLIVVGMMALYWVGALTFSLKLRLAAYDQLLSDALAASERGAVPEGEGTTTSHTDTDAQSAQINCGQPPRLRA